MSTDNRTPFVASPSRLTIPEVRRGLSPRTRLYLVVPLAAALGYGAWKNGIGFDRFAFWPTVNFTTLPVDLGEVDAVVTEYGSLESADNAAVKCRVEALVGLTGGQRGIAAPTTVSNTTAGGAAVIPKITGRAAAKARAGASTAKVQTAPIIGVGGMTPSRAAPAVGVMSSPLPQALPGAAVVMVATGTPHPKPSIRSFTYSIPAYINLRTRISMAVAQRMGWVDPSMMMGGRGGGLFGEKPGSTRILKIVDEGVRAKAGEVVCELDSANFREELKTQKIRYLQARSYVEQAQTILEVNEITLKEYQEGIYPQDAELLRQYVISCRTEKERASKNDEWSKHAASAGFRSKAQVMADALVLEQAELQLSDAGRMADRLEKYTAPRLITSLRAKIEANKSDLYSQEAAFQLEADRLKRLEVAVANCTLRAPRDGVVVYHNPPGAWGRVDDRIREGLTVREGQTLIDLPDPQHMRVRARVNESKVALVHTGQKARIVLDAFPDRELSGTVVEVTPIPSGAGGPISDVKFYSTIVEIDAGLDSLRTGLSAEVRFVTSDPHSVTRVPLEGIRWVEGKPFAAVVPTKPDNPDPVAPTTWKWRGVVLGQTDPDYAEVVSGLTPGERVVADPDELPAPRVSRTTDQAVKVVHL